MSALTQDRAPIFEALQEFKKQRIVPFDVPGHKRGKGNQELTDFLGEKCMSVDVNSMKPLDNLCHPISVIRDAEVLSAEAFGAENAFFMVNGTTSAVQAMIFSACKKNEKIILPRNVHRSVINALILCGAIPVYVNPETDTKLGIPLGMSFKKIAKAVKENPDAKAILVNNPTYYGICSDMKSIAKLTKKHNMLLLADEAHGTHFYFGENMPVSSMKAGADMASVSVHKSGGSLTQSSLLLTGGRVNPNYVRQIINLTQTTSASYLLLSSLDISRKNLYINGKNIFRTVTGFAEYTRNEINKIGDYYAFSKELINGDSVYDIDPTKLAVHTVPIGLAGIEVYDLLRDEYDIQTEFGDIGNILAYISIGDRQKDIERLISALSEIRRRYKKAASGMLRLEYLNPKVVIAPHDAFYSEKIQVPLIESKGLICTEFVMCYPPGIPVLAPGEEITEEVIEYIQYAKAKGSLLTGPEDMDIDLINTLKVGF